MPELDIRVTLPGAPQRSYRFAEVPVLVGRSENCHLIVRHAAMPRELCRIWLEDDGRTVRAEERPGLTNRLLRGGLPVRGGTGGPRLELAVGPVKLLAEPARFRGSPARMDGRRRALAGLGLLAALAGLTWSLGSAPAGGDAPLMPELPQEPLPAGDAGARTAGAAVDPARAALLESRAADLLSRPDAGPAEQVQALLALRQAATLLPEDRAGIVDRHADRLERALKAAYREQSLALERALTRGDAEAASRAARSLLAYLARHDDARIRERLLAIAGGKP